MPEMLVELTSWGVAAAHDSDSSQTWAAGPMRCRVLSPGQNTAVHHDPVRSLLVIADAVIFSAGDRRTRPGLSEPQREGVGVLLARAYARWGDRVVDRIDGEFAFVIIDLERGTAFAAVDPAGVRQLFFHADEGRVVFSTTVDGLGSWWGVDTRVPESRLLDPFLRIEHLEHFEPAQGVDRLRAGHVAKVEAGRVSITGYLQTPPRPSIDEGDHDGWVAALRQHLVAATTKRLEGGTKAGVLLSGGLDSSAVAAIAADQGFGEQVTAYSLVDRGARDCAETLAIDRVAAHTGIEVVRLDASGLGAFGADALRLAAHAKRYVTGRSGFMLLFNELARDAGCAVMMNGVEGDAMFDFRDLLSRYVRAGEFREALALARAVDQNAGFGWMEARLRRIRITSRLPDPVRDGLAWIRGVARRDDAVPHDTLLSAECVRRLRLRERGRRGMAMARVAWRQVEPVPTDMLAHPVVEDGVARFEARSSQVGLRMSCPLLDRPLMEFAAWIPLQYRLRDGYLKWIFRKAMEGILPADVIWRGDKPHIGWKFDAAMLAPVLESVVRDYAGSGPAIARFIDRERFLREVDGFRAGHPESINRLRLPLLLENWLAHNADRVTWGQ